MSIIGSIFRYKIVIKDNFDELAEAIRMHVKVNKFCIISDDNVASLYLKQIKDKLNTVSNCIVVKCFKAGEKSKSLEVVSNIYNFLFENGVDKDCAIIALGGGVVGDVAGFVAATYKRGLKLIHIPTTFLSQVDSCIGGKNGVNFKNNKNMIGSFYHPILIYINPIVMEKLDYLQFSSGLAEVIKYALVADLQLYDFIKINKKVIKGRSIHLLKELIYKSCAIKIDMVKSDERDMGVRRLLNFGHTFGHAIEGVSKYGLNHGQSISIGMICAIYLSVKLGNIPKKYLYDTIRLLHYFELPTKFYGADSKDIFDMIINDKKNINGNINFIILKDVGQGVVIDDVSYFNVMRAIDFVTH